MKKSRIVLIFIVYTIIGIGVFSLLMFNQTKQADKRYGEYEDKLGKADSKIEKMENELQEAENKLDEANDRIDNQNEEMSSMNNNIKELEVSLDEANDKISVYEDANYGIKAYGRLSVNGTKLCSENGEQVQLKGMSTHGITWYPRYTNGATIKQLKDSGANVIRLAVYSDQNDSYLYKAEENMNYLYNAIENALVQNMYVIVDWHVLRDENPNVHKEKAIEFFEEVTKHYGNNKGIIYEICNEPNGGTSWGDIKSYANEIIPVIRANDPDAIIVVGTPTWSQDVDTASWDKITGYDNIMYTLHYYAATHKQWLRDKAQTAINNGCALFVTEFSICDASGNGALDKAEANLWLQFLNKNGISFIGWNLANKNESSSLFLSSCNKISGFADSDLSEWAKWLRDAIGE